MAKIRDVSEAWAWLGAEMERLEHRKAKVGSAFNLGLCWLIDDASDPWYKSSPLTLALHANVSVRVLRQMHLRMNNDLTTGGYIGRPGGAYGVRALWCYLMAEVARG